MANKIWVFQALLLLQYHLVVAMGEVQEKAESATPVTTFSPPEGNTTFLGGTTWCVASAGASQGDLQNALDWACGLGMADCSAIQEGGACYEPDTLLSHASYAFNSYFQQNGNSDIACNFGGTATVTSRDPSVGSCRYTAAGPVASSSASLFNFCRVWWELFGFLMLLFYLKHS
eukprot:TRINITY_DN103678_c0_g1_i1.p1 TRINITY_DN103678_c0_g1~~TRINITY_DN103678_c0_g1_i1.p1  ORF type:complete len:174 (-),score=24.05 TRINITY_DN103678_c0_g1_i1:255-776(-)